MVCAPLQASLTGGQPWWYGSILWGQHAASGGLRQLWFALPGSKNMCASVFSNRSRGTPLPGGVWCNHLGVRGKLQQCLRLAYKWENYEEHFQPAGSLSDGVWRLAGDGGPTRFKTCPAVPGSIS